VQVCDGYPIYCLSFLRFFSVSLDLLVSTCIFCLSKQALSFKFVLIILDIASADNFHEVKRKRDKRKEVLLSLCLCVCLYLCLGLQMSRQLHS